MLICVLTVLTETQTAMSRIYHLLLVLGAVLATTGCKQECNDKFTRFVDPTIGSGAHGHVFVGANVPFGGVQLGPTNISQGWDWTSGYHESDSTVIGFAHTHLSGTGIGDKGDILFMPMTGFNGWSEAEYLSTYDREREVAEAGYYSTYLNRYGITAEMTATPRTGFQKYTFPATDSATILINLERGIGWDKLTKSALKVNSGKDKSCSASYGDVDTQWADVNSNRNVVQGVRLSEGWAKDDRVYFYAEFSKPIKNIADNDGGSKYLLDFGKMRKGENIEVRVGISGVSVKEAQENLYAEQKITLKKVRMQIKNKQIKFPHLFGLTLFNTNTNTEDYLYETPARKKGLSFKDVRQKACQAWNDVLGKIDVETNDTARLRTFYTALYHASFFPAIFSDVSGAYRGADGKNYGNPGHDVYTIFSIWDTYRSAHPLYTITEPKRVSDFINTFIRIYEQQGKVPVWHLAGNETDCMVGFPSVMVIADAILKDIPGFDVNQAYGAIKAYENLDERGLRQIREIGWIPADQEGESVAKALEYCIADWSVAQAAKKLGKTEDYEHFLERSKGYTKYFDSTDGFFKGLLVDGSRRTPFSPLHSQHRGDDFCEGNAWQYLWLVPHDFEGLFALFPDEAAVEAKLDQTFTIPYEATDGSSPDISGLIGQYAQGNEPNHSTIYAYAYLGKQWKTAKLARQIMDELFHDGRDGLCGNEDAGQMSAWYVFNALGFYPANPTNGAFVLGSPVFDKATISLPGDKKFTVTTANNSKDNIYIQSVKLNGTDYPKSYITYDDIMAGGTLEIEMGPTPNETFGSSSENRPRSEML